MTSIYRGQLIDVQLEAVTLPNGCVLELELVRHPGGAVIAALNHRLEVCLLRQYRYAADRQTIWELPAGCIDKTDARPMDTAKRELLEETGIRAQYWDDLGSMLPSPGFCDEELFLYLARGLTLTDARRGEDEIISVRWLPLDEALAMATKNEIRDAKTIVALFRAQQFITSNY